MFKNEDCYYFIAVITALTQLQSRKLRWFALCPQSSLYMNPGTPNHTFPSLLMMVLGAEQAAGRCPSSCIDLESFERTFLLSRRRRKMLQLWHMMH